MRTCLHAQTKGLMPIMSKLIHVLHVLRIWAQSLRLDNSSDHCTLFSIGVVLTLSMIIE